MAFVSCEFSEDLGDALTFARLKESTLVTRCLQNTGEVNSSTSKMMHQYLDENFLISLVHLTLKTWIRTTEPEERKQE